MTRPGEVRLTVILYDVPVPSEVDASGPTVWVAELCVPDDDESPIGFGQGTAPEEALAKAVENSLPFWKEVDL